MTIRRQMMVLIALPTLAIFVVVGGLTSAFMYREARRAVQRDMARLASNYASQFDGHLREAARIAETSARAMESARGITDDEVYDLLAKNVEQTELVYGSCMAFEPGTRKAEGVLFAPYVCREASGGMRRMDIDHQVYDWYRDPKFTWYSQPKSLGRGVWSEPYFDEGAGNILMSTYSAPFRVGAGFGGVNTVDIDLPRLRETVGREYDSDLDFVILAADGRFVFDPDASRIMSKTILDLAREQGNAPLADLGKRMLLGVAGAGVVDRWDGLRSQMVFYAPIRSSGWVFACRVPVSSVMADVRRRAAWSTGALALTLGLIVGSIFVVSRRIAMPISGLRNKVLEVASGNLGARIEESAQAEEIGDLARSFNQMTTDLRTHIDRLAAETSTRHRIEHDIEIARGIQRSLLPTNRPALPGHEVVGWSQSADQTGGDYYDWQALPDGRMIVTLADVSGHGVGPALVTAVCRAYARASFASVQEFSKVVDQLNNLMAGDLSDGRFVTFVAVLLDPATERADVISAGHGPNLHYLAAKKKLVEVETTNLPLGVMAGLDYNPATECVLEPGDFLLLLTDGFFEWQNRKGQMFGLERLRATVLEFAHLPSEEIIKRLYAEVKEFSEGTPQMDDVTAVVVRRVGATKQMSAVPSILAQG